MDLRHLEKYYAKKFPALDKLFHNVQHGLLTRARTEEQVRAAKVVVEDTAYINAELLNVDPRLLNLLTQFNAHLFHERQADLHALCRKYPNEHYTLSAQPLAADIDIEFYMGHRTKYVLPAVNFKNLLSSLPSSTRMITLVASELRYCKMIGKKYDAEMEGLYRMITAVQNVPNLNKLIFKLLCPVPKERSSKDDGIVSRFAAKGIEFEVRHIEGE